MQTRQPARDEQPAGQPTNHAQSSVPAANQGEKGRPQTQSETCAQAPEVISGPSKLEDDLAPPHIHQVQRGTRLRRLQAALELPTFLFAGES